MDDKAKALVEQDKLESIELKARSTYEVRPLKIVEGNPEECSNFEATFYGVYIRPLGGGPGMWVADIATRDDAEFICKCLQVRYV